MARFDVYENQGGGGYLLEVQSDLLSDLNTRIVVPLIPVSVAPEPAERLNPVFRVAGEEVVMTTQFMAAVAERELRDQVGGLHEEHQEISNALDMVFLGFLGGSGAGGKFRSK